MPTVAIKYIVSFSSQDERHPVSNLIKGDGFRKWLCGTQEKCGQIEAVFQLEQSCVISYIDIGSIWCATLEIKVGRSNWPAAREFEVLACTVNLMTPADCVANKNPNKTQMFSPDMFCPDVAKKEWDRVKVVCRQPYRKPKQFGLSFLRVKTSVAAPSSSFMEKKETESLSNSVRDIQKHFLEKLDNGTNKPNSQLKSRLLKIAASSDSGIEHCDSLSRTARLVLAASGNNPKSYSTHSPIPNSEKTGMYSSRVEQKYGPLFDEEMDDFLNQLVIDPRELGSITMADVRHKFERKKRRKLMKEEKKIFIQRVTKYLTSVYKDKPNEKVGEENMNSERKNNLVPDSKISKDRVEGLNSADNVMDNSSIQQESVQVVSKRHSVKRKLESNSITPPSKKLIREKISPLTLIQKMKSSENQSIVERKDLIGQLKKSRQTGPIVDCISSPCGTTFQYRGLRGRESDFDSQVIDYTKCSSPNNLIINENQVSPCMSDDVSLQKFNGLSCSSFMDTVIPVKDVDFGILSPLDLSSDDDQDLCFTSDVMKGRGRGRGNRGRGRGSGRGNGKQSKTPGRGRGQSSTPRRGRGQSSMPRRGRGQGRKWGGDDVSTAISDEEESITYDELVPPRGCTECSGCRDFFGDTLLIAHQQRCVALKSKQKTGAGATLGWFGQGSSTKPPIEARRPSTSSLEVRPTSFVKCGGCDEYFGDALLIHQQNCARWKTLQNCSATMSYDSPWLSARRSPIGQTVSNAANRSNSNNSVGKKSNTSHDGSRGSSNEPMKSPPWLLAAETRLKHHKSSENCTKSSESCTKSLGSPTPAFCANYRMSPSSGTDSSLNSSNSSRLPGQALKSRQRMLAKYESPKRSEQTRDNVQPSGNNCRSISGTTSSGITERLLTGGINGRRSSGIERSRFCVADLSSDDDDDVGVGGNIVVVGNKGPGEVQVACPLCGDHYPTCLIEMHASDCYL